MQLDVLSRLYVAQPSTKEEIANATGYAVFSSANLAAVYVSAGYGYGVAHDNKTGADIYMQMASAGLGLGLGVKDFRAVFVFTDPATFSDFLSKGLDMSGQADLSAKEGAKGKAISGGAPILPVGIKVYQLTDTGLMAQLMVQGTKYWKDDYLNGSGEESNTNKIGAARVE
jgi:lipid-binding SYLF domain-containing protein